MIYLQYGCVILFILIVVFGISWYFERDERMAVMKVLIDGEERAVNQPVNNPDAPYYLGYRKAFHHIAQDLIRGIIR